MGRIFLLVPRTSAAPISFSIVGTYLEHNSRYARFRVSHGIHAFSVLVPLSFQAYLRGMSPGRLVSAIGLHLVRRQVQLRERDRLVFPESGFRHAVGLSGVGQVVDLLMDTENTVMSAGHGRVTIVRGRGR